MTNAARFENTGQGPGIVEWLRPGEYERAEDIIQNLSALNIRHLRTDFTWTDWQTPQGREWFDWLIPKVAGKFELLPSFTCTPPLPERTHADADPPCDPRTFADFVETMIREYGEHFEWLELGNSLDDHRAWDWRLDSSWKHFSQMVGNAAYRAKQHGKKPVLAGIAPSDLNWLDLLCSAGILQHIDALGINGFPGTWDFEWNQWPSVIAQLQGVLNKHELSPQLWITAVGYSTWRHDEIVQLQKLREVLSAPVTRVYWYSAFDHPPDHPCPEYIGEDERCYHFGLKTADGKPKLIHRIWQERGLDGLIALTDHFFRDNRCWSHDPVGAFSEKAGLSVVSPHRENRPVLITGGAGFVGTNLALRLAQEGRNVVIFDNLTRPGVERNLEYLLKRHAKQVCVIGADIRDPLAVRDAVQRASQVYHFAAQVAVTTSVEAPREDFDINLNGTLNLLESLRELDDPPPLLFTSTHKVYGALEDVALQRIDGRYQPVAESFSAGISEQQGLDFHCPYGCSKGAADQYVLDYSRSYGLPAAVFRISCVYGPHQFGTEDQGWVAHFFTQVLQGRSLTLYGDGHQVRDLLFVEDLVEAMRLAQERMPDFSGRAFNIGGGVENSTSLLEVLARIERLTERRSQYHCEDWRLGDQRYYISDTRSFQSLSGWRPVADIDTGLRRMHDWLSEQLFAAPATATRSSIPPQKVASQQGKLS